VQRLSGVDGLFIETETKRMPQAVVAVLVLDPSGIPGGYSYQVIKEHFASRLDEIPAFRRRLMHVPLRIGRSILVDDPDFDIDAHIHRAGLPAPGGRRELAEFVADVAGRSLDRDKPLWQAWVVEGLEHGHVALVAKSHHSLMDGVTGAGFISRLFDLTPPESHDPEATLVEGLWAPPRLPSQLGLLFQALPHALAEPVVLARSSVGAARGVLSYLRAAVLRPEGTPAPTLPFTAPTTPFNRSISSQRTIAYARAQLADLKTIKNAYGCTINDVVIAACGISLRHWLRDHGGVPDRPLVATLPVSVSDTQRVTGNKVSTMFVKLPTTTDDPARALRSVHDDTTQAKSLHQALGAETIMELAELAPRTLTNLATQFYTGFNLADHHRPIYNVIISNVPGPPVPLYLYGAELVAFYPHGPIFEGTGLNITVMSYQDSVDVGVIGDRDSVPDVEQIAGGFVRAVRDLLATLDASPDGLPRPLTHRPGPMRTRRTRSSVKASPFTELSP
jgi:diacylglycerol O-acyltransferase / wax synthase